MTQHTPGPWKVSNIIHNSSLKPHDRKGYAGSVAYVWTDRAYPDGVCIASVREELLGEVEANARLIACAPEMLDKLKELSRKTHEINALQHSGIGNEPGVWGELYQATNEAKAIIAKAEGRD